MARDARDVGGRIEQLLGGLKPGRDRETAEELVRLLVSMYGDGLTRIVALAQDTPLLEAMLSDSLVESLLLLHDLHPVDVDTRIQRALDGVRPYLGSHAGGVEYLGVDSAGVARLRLQGNCHGCPSSTMTVKMAIEGAIMNAAPEINGVEVAGVTAPPAPSELLQIGMGPPPGTPTWNTIAEVGPPTGRAQTVSVEGTTVMLCSVRGTLYAYRDSCACGSSLDSAHLSDFVLTCPACETRFDVRNAGRGLDDPTQHLDPLPLLSDSQGVRVAVPT